MTAALAAGEGRQVITTSIAAVSSRAEARRRGAGGDERRTRCGSRSRTVSCDAVASQVAGELAADVAETDEADAQVDHAETFPGGWASKTSASRPVSAR